MSGDCHRQVRGAETILLPDEPRDARQAGDCFGAARLAMTGGSGDSAHRESALDGQLNAIW
jgi:hypothetical protein